MDVPQIQVYLENGNINDRVVCLPLSSMLSSSPAAIISGSSAIYVSASASVSPRTVQEAMPMEGRRDRLVRRLKCILVNSERDQGWVQCNPHHRTKNWISHRPTNKHQRRWRCVCLKNRIYHSSCDHCLVSSSSCCHCRLMLAHGLQKKTKSCRSTAPPCRVPQPPVHNTHPTINRASSRLSVIVMIVIL